MRNQSLPSIMNHAFSQVPAPNVQRSVFDRSYGHKTTFNSGLLIPFHVDEILPNDTVSMKTTIFARLATLINPLMDNLFLDAFFFWVPARLLWNHWEQFMGAQANPADTIDYEIPYLTVTGTGLVNFAEGSLGDYLGLPILDNMGVGSDIFINALPFRAYGLIWNTWFRDENLQNSVAVNLGDGPDTSTLTNWNVLRRGKRHDYFTSCLPWPQKGDSVAIPLGTTAPVIGDGYAMGMAVNGATDYRPLMNQTVTAYNLRIAGSSSDQVVGANAAATAADTNAKFVGLSSNPLHSHLLADLSSATSATINQLREAFATQQLLEQFARGGTRYVELLKATFNAYLPDYTAQRPEYLGGYSQRIQVSQVPQTSESSVDSPQANLAAYGQVASECSFHKTFVEHGYVIGLVSVRADITYQQNIRKMWSRRTRYDFYWPAFAHLGEQAVLNMEIYYGNEQDPLGTFGYQERWAEYRYFPSMVTGKFRSNATGSLDSWHLALDFDGTGPDLNSTFIQDNPPVQRVVAVQSPEPEIIMDTYNSIRHARPMPVYSVPGLLRL
jgi:hypothetical protein